jgi:hypothetical protein
MRALPYETGGNPAVIRSLLKYLPSDNIYIIGRTPEKRKRLNPGEVKQKMYSIPVPFTRGYRFWKYFSIIHGFFIGLYIIKRYKVRDIFGVFQDDASLILSFVLAKTFPGVRYFPYFTDLYAEQRDGRKRLIADYFQHKVYKRSTFVFVVNDGIKEYLNGIYSDFHKIITLPMISVNEHWNNFIPRKRQAKFTVTFSGTINDDRLETLELLLQLFQKEDRFRFVYLTAHSQEELKSFKVFYDGFEAKFCKTQKELVEELGKSDLLYLPIRFTYPPKLTNQLMTCFGAKTLDYLAIPVPILVHSPKDFYNYKMLKNANAAFCLDSLEPERIIEFKAHALLPEFLIKSETIIGNARALRKKFDGELIANNFLNILDDFHV